jgi:hypothetical protein
MLDLSKTELEGDEWCDEADRALNEAADELERLNGVLLAISEEARNAATLDRWRN